MYFFARMGMSDFGLSPPNREPMTLLPLRIWEELTFKSDPCISTPSITVLPHPYIHKTTNDYITEEIYWHRNHATVRANLQFVRVFNIMILSCILVSVTPCALFFVVAQFLFLGHLGLQVDNLFLGTHPAILPLQKSTHPVLLVFMKHI